MPSPLALKLLLVPSCIGLVSLAARRWGSNVGGLLAGLPVVAGPILFLLWVQQGPEFARGAIVYSLASVCPGIAFVAAYGWFSRICKWPVAVVMAYATWILFAAVVLTLPSDIITATLLATASLLVAPYTLPRTIATPFTAPHARFEIALRMLTGFALTLLVTSVATAGDRRISGVLSMFPVLSPILAASVHRAAGSAAVIAILRGLAGGLWSLVAFCVTLATSSTETPLYAFGSAIGVAIAVQLLVLRTRPRWDKIPASPAGQTAAAPETRQ